jgi:hypothetical protein
MRPRLASSGPLVTPLAGLEISPVIDTLEVFFPILDREQRQVLRRYGELKLSRRCWGSWRLVVTLPSPQVLHRLDGLAAKYRGVVNRVDIALEINGADHQLVRLWIETHALLRHRRKGPMETVETTLYWCKSKRNRRDLVLYSDRHNRVTGEIDCVHLELRIKRAEAVRQQGIYRVRDLLTLDPHQLFARNVGWTDLSDRYARSVIRHNVAEYERNCAGRELDEFETAYGAHLPHWLRWVLHVLGYDRPQVLKDNLHWRTCKQRMNKAKSLSGLPIPTVLDWPPASLAR